MKLTITFDVERPNFEPKSVTITSERIIDAIGRRASYRNMFIENYVAWLLSNLAELNPRAHLFKAVKGE